MLRKFTSNTASEMFWTMNDMPTAVIRTASLGALRNLRYAISSMLAFTAAPNAIAIRNTAASPSTTATVPEVSSRWKRFAIRLAMNSPVSANTSPCAKLISCRIP